MAGVPLVAGGTGFVAPNTKAELRSFGAVEPPNEKPPGLDVLGTALVPLGAASGIVP